MIYVQTTSVTVLSVVQGCSGPSQPYLQARTQQQTDLKKRASTKAHRSGDQLCVTSLAKVAL